MQIQNTDLTLDTRQFLLQQALNCANAFYDLARDKEEKDYFLREFKRYWSLYRAEVLK